MAAFRMVSADRAGPEALGILVPPPAQRTLVVVRPRALDIDLVVVRPGPDGGPGNGFEEVSRGVALTLARNLGRALIQPEEGQIAEVRSIPGVMGEGFNVLATIGPFMLMMCARVPGQPYRPGVFSTTAEAEQTAQEVARILCPGPDGRQELYTNVQDFTRE